MSLDVLFLSQRVPYPPDRGDRITTWHLLRHLHAGGCRLRIGCLSEDARDIESSQQLTTLLNAEVCAPLINRRARRWLSLRGLLTGEALTLPFFRDRRLQTQIDAWYRERPPEFVYAFSSSMGQYILHHTGAPRVMHFAELDSDKWSQYASQRRGLGRWIYNREARRLLQFETRMAREFDGSVVVSHAEKELFMKCIPDFTPEVLPNGVDVEHFVSAGEAQREPHTIVFTGVMDYEPNVDGVLWFVRECWPTVRARFADARFLIVGSRPTAAIMALTNEPGIEVTGRVPETPPYFDRARVAVAPLRLARGLQNKVLEAMSMGLPVVATPPAARGLGNVPSDTLLVAQDAPAFSRVLLELLTDPASARQVGARAAAYVRAHYQWSSVFDQFDAIVERSMQRRIR